jgi:hypothetical protein
VIFIWLGAILIIAGVVVTAAPPIWLGRLSRLRRVDSGQASNTLEPNRPAKGLGLHASWPGLAMIGVGAVLMLLGATS